MREEQFHDLRVPRIMYSLHLYHSRGGDQTPEFQIVGTYGYQAGLLDADHKLKRLKYYFMHYFALRPRINVLLSSANPLNLASASLSNAVTTTFTSQRRATRAAG